MYRKVTIASLIILISATLLVAALTYKKYRIAPAIAFTELEALNSAAAKVKIWPQTGRGVIVVFYASWCHDCARELPKLGRALQGPLKGAQVVALTDEDLPTMIRYRNQSQYPFAFFSLPRDFENYGIHAIPTFYLLNAQGDAVFTKVGDVDWGAAELLTQARAAGI